MKKILVALGIFLGSVGIAYAAQTTFQMINTDPTVSGGIPYISGTHLNASTSFTYINTNSTADIWQVSSSTNTLFANITAAGNFGLGTSTPGTIFSIGNVGVNTINISNTATSTFGSGINIKTGCYSIAGSCLSSSGGGTPGGSTKQIQYNNAGSFAGGTEMQFDPATRWVAFGQGPMNGMTFKTGSSNTAYGYNEMELQNAYLTFMPASTSPQAGTERRIYADTDGSWKFNSIDGYPLNFIGGSNYSFDSTVNIGSNFALNPSTHTISLDNTQMYTFGATNNKLRFVAPGELDFNPGPGGPVYIRDSVAFGSFNDIDVLTSGGMAFGAGYGAGYLAPTNGMIIQGKVGFGTTSPWRQISVTGSSDLGSNALAGNFTATTSTASTFPYASTTAITATTVCLTGDTCRTTWPTGGSSFGYPWTLSTNYATNNQATTGIEWFQNGLNASSTSHLVNASTTAITATSVCLTGDICRTTWPSGGGVSGGTAGMLTSWTNSTTLTATGTPTFASFYATSTSATSTVMGGVVVGNTALVAPTTQASYAGARVQILDNSLGYSTYTTANRGALQIGSYHGATGVLDPCAGMFFGEDNFSTYYAGSGIMQQYEGCGTTGPISINPNGGGVAINGLAAATSLAPEVGLTVVGNSAQNAYLKVNSNQNGGQTGILFRGYNVLTADSYTKAGIAFDNTDTCSQYCRGNLRFMLDFNATNANVQDAGNLDATTRMIIRPNAGFTDFMVGIGTTTPYAKLSVQGAGGTIDLFAVATSSGKGVFGIDADGHRFTAGPTPAITNGSDVGDDSGGTITTNAAVSSVTMTFAKAYQLTPYCKVTDDSLTISADVSSISTTAVTFSLSAPITSGHLYYECAYHK